MDIEGIESAETVKTKIEDQVNVVADTVSMMEDSIDKQLDRVHGLKVQLARMQAAVKELEEIIAQGVDE